MIKAQSIIGKPVLSRADGERLDSVKDVIIGKDHTHVIALIISEGGLFSKPTVVPINNVVNFGKDAVVITDKQAATKADHVPEVAEALDVNKKLGGKAVFSETGEQHGKLADIYFDEKTGSITGVDVTDLGPGSASKQTAFLDMSDVISFGTDAVVISAGAVSKLQGAVASPQGQPAQPVQPEQPAQPEQPEQPAQTAATGAGPDTAPQPDDGAPTTMIGDSARMAEDTAEPGPGAPPDTSRS
jgi:uncharacterized protein YrrD